MGLINHPLLQKVLERASVLIFLRFIINRKKKRRKVVAAGVFQPFFGVLPPPIETPCSSGFRVVALVAQNEFAGERERAQI